MFILFNKFEKSSPNYPILVLFSSHSKPEGDVQHRQSCHACKHVKYFSDWISIYAGNRIPSYGSQIQSLELRTEGQGHFDLHFMDLVGFQCDLYDGTTSYKFDLHYPCDDYYNSCCYMYGVPTGSVRIWTLTLTPTTLYIYCRRDGEGEVANVEVTRVSYSAVSHCLTEYQWPSLLNDVEIFSDDRVTRAYRTISGATYILSLKF